MAPLLVCDSTTVLGRDAAGAVLLCGSHGGALPARQAARALAHAAIFNDAGIGKDGAGLGGVEWLGERGIPACAADHRSARIGDGRDLQEYGVVSHANAPAAALGCRAGMACAEAAARMAAAPPVEASAVPPETGGRQPLPAGGHRPAFLLDSAAYARPEDKRCIVVTGSHGGLLGGREDDGVLAIDIFAAFFNDAGLGKGDAGAARLHPLDRRGVAAATVSANTARIGEAWSTYDTGVISRVNDAGRRLGLAEGLSAREAVARLLGLA